MSSQTVKTFPQGGIHPADNKISAQAPIAPVDTGPQVRIPVSQHIGAPAEPVVKTGDTVVVGQLIAKSQGFISANVHSSVSGTVEKIDDIFDVSGYRRKAIVIKVEGDTWDPAIDRSTQLVKAISVSPTEIFERVKSAGIVGLGGATFPTHVKLTVPEGKKIEFILINGVECEPYLTSDHRLMLEKAEEIFIGIELIKNALQIDQAIIGIEENKPDAIEKMQTLSAQYGTTVQSLKVHYPQGGERQLVKALVNREIPPPPRGLPIDAGCAVFNVATVLSIYEAVQKNKPLFERVVSVTGKSIKKPSNFLTRFGTPLELLFEAAGGVPQDTGKILCGGPMMGRALGSTDIPVTKGMSGIVAFKDQESARKEVYDCIRCGKCVAVCPLGLEPYLLMTLSEKELWERAEQEKVTNCCECACCSFICPSNRPLLDYLKYGKSAVLNIMRSRK